MDGISPAEGLAIFDTAIGRCGIAWTGRGVAGLQLPEETESATVERLRHRFPHLDETVPTGAALDAVAAVVDLMAGQDVDLSGVPLDFEGVTPFHRTVYESLRRTPRGTTLTYGELAALAGSPGAARAVGSALRRNPLAILVPCHRVVAAGGKLGGFSAAGGPCTKTRMLGIEGVRVDALTATAGVQPEGLDFDPITALKHLIATDPELGRLIDAVGPFQMQLGTTPSIFVALVRSITYQQLSGKAAGTIYGRLCALFEDPEAGPTAEGLLRLSDEQLRGAGVSRNKILSMRDLAERQLAGQIPTLAEARLLGDEELVERLTPVRGIGRWTVEMLLMFRLGRPDVLPTTDLGIRNGFARAFGVPLPLPAEIAARGERWRPYRTVASWYLWRAAEMKDQEPV
ncbi:MAG TPA: methylated-DNA--[protein]-cysteine S-methyltransferase [Actinomycetota bacterium]|nr:methylated-DNA--[protein]-cysteine S-methyltransferase [Actinomycetota bacterium]